MPYILSYIHIHKSISHIYSHIYTYIHLYAIRSYIHIHTSICHIYSHIYTYIHHIYTYTHLIWCISSVSHGHEPWKYPYNIYAGDSHGSWPWETHNIHFIICKSPVCVYMRVNMAYIAMRVSCLHIIFHTYYLCINTFLHTHTHAWLYMPCIWESPAYILYFIHIVLCINTLIAGAWVHGVVGGWVGGWWVCVFVCV